MADAKTLEDRIREKAVAEYEKMAMREAEAFFKSLGFTTYREFNLGFKPKEGETFRRLDPHKLRTEIVNQAVYIRKQEIGDKAVEDFLKKVETLSDEVDDIRSLIDN